jgi:hypothetical protein
MSVFAKRTQSSEHPRKPLLKSHLRENGFVFSKRRDGFRAALKPFGIRRR